MVELLVTDPVAVRTRPTDDVDIVVRVTTRVAYHRVQQRLGALGFMPDIKPGAPICRVRTPDDLVLDVLTVEEGVLGFTNRWYPLAVETAVPHQLAPDLTILAVTAPAFLATKWEAFRNRGANDPLLSHDLEDVVTLVAGRESVVREMAALPDDARRFVAEMTRGFLATRWAEEIVAGSLPDAQVFPELAVTVLARLHALASA